VKAAGGYSGISSSTLACHVDSTVIDEGLAMAQCLAISATGLIFITLSESVSLTTFQWVAKKSSIEC